MLEVISPSAPIENLRFVMARVEPVRIKMPGGPTGSGSTVTHDLCQHDRAHVLVPKSGGHRRPGWATNWSSTHRAPRMKMRVTPDRNRENSWTILHRLPSATGPAGCDRQDQNSSKL